MPKAQSQFIIKMDESDLREQVATYFDSSYGTLIICSEDIIAAATIVNGVVRSVGHPDYNVVLCICDDSPIFITPRDGIGAMSKVILITPEVPPSWNKKPNVLRYASADVIGAEVKEDVVDADMGSLKVTVNKEGMTL